MSKSTFSGTEREVTPHMNLGYTTERGGHGGKKKKNIFQIFLTGQNDNTNRWRLDRSKERRRRE